MPSLALRLAAVLSPVALLLSACGDDNPTGAFEGDSAAAAVPQELTSPPLQGTISGSGSSAQESAMTAWIAGYRGVQPDVTMIYDAIGSGGGRENLISGASPVVGSDAALSERERDEVRQTCGPEGAVHIPAYIAPIAIPFNLPGIEQINFSPEVLAQVMDREIREWDDPAIAHINPDVDLPSTRITVVNRSDESGTTENFLEYLEAVGGRHWPYAAGPAWPVEGGESAQQTTGVMQVVGNTEGAITYTDASAVGTLPTASIGVGDEFVDYSAEAAAAAVDASERANPDSENDLALELERDSEDSNTYPIVLVSYLIACSEYDDSQTKDIVTSFLRYVVSEEGQQAAEEAAGSAPISGDLRAAARDAIDSIEDGSRQ